MRRLGQALREPSIELLAGLVAGGLILMAVVVRSVVVSRVAAPQILCDEFIYGGIARGVEDGAGFTYRGVPLDFSWVYPLLIAPAWLLSPMDSTFEAAKLVNVAVMTLAAVPVYVWARRLVSPVWSLVACLLVLLMPAFAFTGLLMTENASFTAFVAATLAMAYALERRTLTAQTLAVIAIGVAMATRYQNAVLVPAYFAAVGLILLFDHRGGVRGPELLQRARRHARPLIVLALAAGAYLAYKRIQTGRFGAALGPYEDLRHGSYPLRDVLRWSVLHFGELSFATAVVPVCALGVLLVLALRGDARSDAERAFVAVAAPTVLLTVIQVGAFASHVANWVVERYSFYVVPLLLLALVVWAGRGLPRPRWTTVGAAVVPVLAVTFLLMDFRDFLFASSLPVNTLSLYSVQRLPLHLDGNQDRAAALVAVGVLLAAAAFVVLPKAAARVLLPLGVGVTLFVLARPVVGATRGLAETSRLLAGPMPAWVDDAIGADASAALVITPQSDVYTSSAGLLQTEFWNRSIGRVGHLGGSEICPLPADGLTVDPATGQIERQTATGSVPLASRYVVIPTGTDVHGTLVAQGGTPLAVPLSLYRVSPPLRIETSTNGIQADGWMSSDASYARYAAPGPGSVQVSLSRAAWTGPDKPGHVRIRIGRLRRAADGTIELRDPRTVRWTIHSGGSRTFTLPAPRPPFRVEIHVDPTFSPADYGGADTRQLGAQVGFTYVPRAS